MAPLVCPRPGPHGPGPDCPLWDARERIALQRSVEADGAARAGMGALVWASMNRDYKRPASSPTRPIPIEARPIAALVSPETERVVAGQGKEVPAHV